MNKVITKILLVMMVAPTFAFARTSVAVTPTTTPVPQFVVQFEKTPLFGESNILPGDTVTRWIKVTNNTGKKQSIVVRVANASDSYKMGDVMKIIIKEGTAKLYDDSLTNFIKGNAITLSDLGNNKNTRYDLTVSFDSSAGNKYQSKNLRFDILIGYPCNTGHDNGYHDGREYFSDNPWGWNKSGPIFSFKPTPIIIPRIVNFFASHFNFLHF